MNHTKELIAKYRAEKRTENKKIIIEWLGLIIGSMVGAILLWVIVLGLYAVMGHN